MTKQEALMLTEGDKVYCLVPAVRGWYTVTAVRAHDGYLKLVEFRPWCPPYNFSVLAPTEPNA